ncbi:hypothetical protein ACH4TU_08260 [Streptomyces physcomitrii]|uniref:aromatic-ring hydroxylase C-terminal domain-containing protein n=1 Tax=Streptomyces physcomitrii TaxID=2724184 RepID=UPI0037B0BA2A
MARADRLPAHRGPTRGARGKARHLRGGCAPALLVRPDGYIAWAGEPDRDAEGLHAALTHWFGAPAA